MEARKNDQQNETPKEKQEMKTRHRRYPEQQEQKRGGERKGGKTRKRKKKKYENTCGRYKLICTMPHDTEIKMRTIKKKYVQE